MRNRFSPPAKEQRYHPGDLTALVRDVGTALLLCAEAVAQTPAVRAVLDHPGMPQNFLTCDRNQPLLLPPDLRDWLPEDHLAWFVIEAIEELDLEPFYAAYRADGHGRAAHEPKMMLTLIAYSYAVGERSSRGIERRCREDVAFRVITANQIPDHATIARFRVRHEQALADLFGQVLGLCADAGLVDVGVLAVDGTKLAASASNHATRSYEQIAKEIVAEAGRIDRAEDELHGEARGDELPEQLASREGRRAWLRRPSSASRQSEPPSKSRFRGTARSGSSSATSAWSRTGAASAGPTGITRPIAHAE
jgi:transposase